MKATEKEKKAEKFYFVKSEAKKSRHQTTGKKNTKKR